MAFLIPEDDVKGRKGEKRKKISSSRKKSLMDKLVSEWNEGMFQKPDSDESSEADDEDTDLYGENKKVRGIDDDLLTDEEDAETTQEKRLRLSKVMLDAIAKEEQDRAELKEVSKETIAHRLREEVLEKSGRLYKKVADNIIGADSDNIKLLRGHKLPITCLVISPDNKFVYSGSKDCSIIKWSLETYKKVKMIHGGRKGTEDRHLGHTAHVLSLAISTDNKFLVSGCGNGVMHIWCPDTMQLLKTFKMHKGAITGLTFQRGTHNLFSCSADRSVKTWNLDEMAFVETLYGHLDNITAIDGNFKERAITAGGRDSTVRVWKILEESQLVFSRGGNAGGSIDCVKALNDNVFITGGDDGMLHLWNVTKKHPIHTKAFAHGTNPDNTEPHWITAVGTLVNTDLSASGSMNGSIRIWKCSEDYKTLEPLFSIVNVAGFMNALSFTSDARFMVAGVGQEHRLGRWWRLGQAKNGVLIIPLQLATDKEDKNGDESSLGTNEDASDIDEPSDDDVALGSDGDLDGPANIPDSDADDGEKAPENGHESDEGFNDQSDHE